MTVSLGCGHFCVLTIMAKRCHLFNKYRESINWVKLFGSRAHGDYRPTFDLINYESQTNEKLKKSIDTEGIIIWEVDEKGRSIMTEEQLVMKYMNL